MGLHRLVVLLAGGVFAASVLSGAAANQAKPPTTPSLAKFLQDKKDTDQKDDGDKNNKDDGDKNNKDDGQKNNKDDGDKNNKDDGEKGASGTSGTTKTAPADKKTADIEKQIELLLKQIEELRKQLPKK